MKKLLLGCAVVALVAASCQKQSDSASPVDKGLIDSISQCYGKNVGNHLLADYLSFSQTHTANKQDMVKGMMLAIELSDDNDMLLGLQVGVQIAQQMKSLEEDGIVIDKAKFMNNFKQAFMADTLDMQTMTITGGTLMTLMERAHAQIEAAAEPEPQAVQNGLANQAYIDNLKAEDPEIETTPTGLSYKIINPGQGVHATFDDQIVVNYVGTLTDGKQFDAGTEATFMLDGVIPGFAEGLAMLGKGGKAIFYIPGNLAYGERGIPQAGIGPNQTLIFDVEVVDIIPINQE